MMVLDSLKKKHLTIVCRLLLNGNLVSFPTETVYGVACVYDNFKAYEKLNDLKQRPKGKPYTIMLSKVSDISKYAIIKNIKIKKFLKKIFPGSVTIILPSKKNVFPYLSYHGRVGIRIPKNKTILWIINFLNKGLLVSSLNVNGENPIKDINIIKYKFINKLSAVVKMNTTISDVPSTVITFENDKIKLLREGEISFEYLNNIYEKI